MENGHCQVDGADIGYTPTEVAAKEVLEETGFEVDDFKLLAIFDKEKHQPSPSVTHVYKIFIGCKIVGGEKKTSIETEDVEFFGEDELPTLSIARNTEDQIKKMFAYMKEPMKEILID